MSPAWFFVVALALDLGLGDPPLAWHPVRLLGKAIGFLEARARAKGAALSRRGLGLTLLVVSGSWLAGLAWLQGFAWVDHRLHLHGWLLLAAGSLLLKASFALRDLWDHARAVLKPLDAGDLLAARLAVARMVGRDTQSLDDHGVRRACVESVAEGLCDSVVAPLFFTLLGGPALAFAYRAVNTLDSMLGHKDARFREIGWAPAKLDDGASWIPARLAAFFTALAAPLCGLSLAGAVGIAVVDGPRQPSPNSGWPEGAFAGALGVQLGGELSYRGKAQVKPFLGVPRLALDAFACGRALRLLLASGLLAAFSFAALSEGMVRLPQLLTR